MNPSEIKKRAFLAISITNRCQLNCRICFKALKSKSKTHFEELPVETWKSFIKEYFETFQGNTEVDISGGEPLLYRDLYTLLHFIKENKGQSAIASNGVMLNKEIVLKLRDCGLNKINISIDSLNSYVHDHIRGKKGVLVKALRGIELLKEYAPQIKIGLHTVLNGFNLQDIPALYEYVLKENGISHIYFQAIMRPLEMPMKGAWYLRPPLDLLWPELKEIRKCLEYLLSKKKEPTSKIGNNSGQLSQYLLYFENPAGFHRKLECTLSDYFMSVSPEGNIQSCYSRSGPIGRVEEHNLPLVKEKMKKILSNGDKNHCKEGCFFLLNCFAEREYRESVTINKIMQKKDLIWKKLNSGKEERPLYSSIVIENGCPMHCKMCNYWQNKPEHMTPEIFEKVMESLSQLLKPGIPVQLTGGEPLLNPFLTSLIDIGNRYGFLMAVVTSGYLLNEKKTEALAKTPLFTLSFSVDSLIPERQDFLRGKKGVLEKIFSSIALLKRINPEIKIDILTTLMEFNRDEILSLVKWADNNPLIHKIYFQTINRPLLSKDSEPDWKEDKTRWFLWPASPAKMEELLDELISLKKSGSKINNTFFQLETFKNYFTEQASFKTSILCKIYKYALNVDIKGNFYYCYAFPAIGNCEELNINSILFSEKSKKLKREISKCKESCMFILNCIYNENNFDSK